MAEHDAVAVDRETDEVGRHQKLVVGVEVSHPRPLVASPVRHAAGAQHRERLRRRGQLVGDLWHGGVDVDDPCLLGDVALDALHGGRGEGRLPGDALAALDGQRSRGRPDGHGHRYAEGVEVGDVGDARDACLRQVGTDPGQGARRVHRPVGPPYPVLVGP